MNFGYVTVNGVNSNIYCAYGESISIKSIEISII